MALVARTRLLLSFASLSTVTATLLSSSDLRAALLRLFSPTLHPLRLAALLLALLLNIKNVPLVWHIRLFRHMAYQLRVNTAPPLPPHALFRPAITSNMYTPLPECDYNGHKSNSTYFTDLDMSRGQFITCLLREGLRRAGVERAERKRGVKRRHSSDAPSSNLTGSSTSSNTISSTIGASGGGITTADVVLHEASAAQSQPPPADALYTVALGAVSCHFRREIAPYERYEIWTRVLSWDRKWLYLISHVVRAGVARPDDYVMQPWRRRQRSRGKEAGKHDSGAPTAAQTDTWRAAVFATSVSRYVVKNGRLTVPVETVLAECGLLPPGPKPEPASAPANAAANAAEGYGTATAAAAAAHTDDDDADDDDDDDNDEANTWTWAHVERRRQAGLAYAEAFGGLERLHDAFPHAGEQRRQGNGRIEVVGEWRDLLW